MKICLDAGHYGKYNRSPVVPSYYESDMTWKLHLRLKTALEAYGVEVITSRPSQAQDLALEARGKKAAGCDLFISLHSNACGTESVDYPLACCCVSGKANELGAKLAQVVQTTMSTKQTGRIINKKWGWRDYYGVLRGAAAVGVPGILLEHSFHTNKDATNWLRSDYNLERLALAEAACIAEHYGLKKAPAAQPVAPAQPGVVAPRLVRINCSSLNVRSGPGVEYKVNTVVKKNEVYTIVDESNGWGKLKSGAGWISLKYTKNV